MGCKIKQLKNQGKGKIIVKPFLEAHPELESATCPNTRPDSIPWKESGGICGRASLTTAVYHLSKNEKP
jgi:hypothetical protein